MTPLEKGRYLAFQAKTDAEIEMCQRLRYACFGLSDASGVDRDAYDALCQHVVILDQSRQYPVASFRIMFLESAQDIDQSYTAQFYNLDALRAFSGPLLEIGRLCIDASCKDPDVLRLIWAMVTKFVDDKNIALLFGCASFQGTNPSIYLDAFLAMRQKYLAPKQWRPLEKSDRIFRFPKGIDQKPNVKGAVFSMPPLLQTYLLMGGWVSDHAVIDAELNTMHVFTGVEIARIPPQRKRLLRALT